MLDTIRARPIASPKPGRRCLTRGYGTRSESDLQRLATGGAGTVALISKEHAGARDGAGGDPGRSARAGCGRPRAERGRARGAHRDGRTSRPLAGDAARSRRARGWCATQARCDHVDRSRPSPSRSRARTPAETASQRSRRLALRTKPTITGSLDVRRAEGEGYQLVWDAVPTVTEWEVRFSERPDLRSGYAERESSCSPPPRRASKCRSATTHSA